MDDNPIKPLGMWMVRKEMDEELRAPLGTYWGGGGPYSRLANHFWAELYAWNRDALVRGIEACMTGAPR